MMQRLVVPHLRVFVSLPRSARSVRPRGISVTREHPTSRLRALSVCVPRHRSQEAAKSDATWGAPTISYDELKPHTQSPTEDLLLIDVREPPEFTQGNIPSSVNLPLSELEEALKLEPNDFKRKYSFSKPKTDKKIVFYCLAGVRAAAAAKEFRSQHYQDVQNFAGSYQEWTKREGKWSDDED